MSDEFYFDPSQQEGSNFQLIPIGKYAAEIIEATLAVPSSGDGHMLNLTWRITDGEHEGRQVWDHLCYQHSNAVTEGIARRKIKDICVALDITEQVNDPKMFLYKSMQVRVGIQRDKQGVRDDRNVISRVRPLNAPDEPAPTPTPSGPAPAAAAKSAAKPAAKKPADGLGAAPWKKTA